LERNGKTLGLVKKLGFVLAPARTRLTPPAEAAASQKWKIIYLQVLMGITNHEHRESIYLRAYKAPGNWRLSTVLGPLHLSRILYKSTLFMQNKPNFPKSQMNVNPYNTTDYENNSNWTFGQNKPNSNPMSKQFVWSKPRRAESAKMAQQIDVLKHQNITLKKSNFLYPNRLNSLNQHNPPTGTSFAYLEYMR